MNRAQCGRDRTHNTTATVGTVRKWETYTSVTATSHHCTAPGSYRWSCSQLVRSEEHTSELQSRPHLVCRLLLEKKNRRTRRYNREAPTGRQPLAPEAFAKSAAASDAAVEKGAAIPWSPPTSRKEERHGVLRHRRNRFHRPLSRRQSAQARRADLRARAQELGEEAHGAAQRLLACDRQAGDRHHRRSRQAEPRHRR